MEKYFDAFVYVANWGTRQLMLQLPARLCDLEVLRPYLSENAVIVTPKDERLILQFLSEDEPEGWEEGEGWMASLMPLRAELMQGDLRCLYLGWLLAAQSGELAADEEEPVVPPGLRSLSASLQSFADFMRIDLDLIEAAAVESSDPEISAPSKQGLQAWISTLSDSDKNATLRRLLEQDDALFRLELLKRLQSDISHRHEMQTPAGKRRTVEELLSAARNITTEKQRKEAERRAADEARKKQRRRPRVPSISNSSKAASQSCGCKSTTSCKHPSPRITITHLVDLRDLATRTKQTGEFKSRLSQLRQRYSTRPSFQQRLVKAGLGNP